MVGYSRAVRVGNVVVVVDTTGVGDDIVAQTRVPCAGTAFALAQAGAPRSDVVRTRMYVTDISPCVRWARYTRRCSGKFGRW